MPNFHEEKCKMAYPVTFDKDKAKELTEWENKVVCMDCVQGMKQLPATYADLFVFSSRYDTLRTYKGNSAFDSHATGEQVFRILKDGGVCAMVIRARPRTSPRHLQPFARLSIGWTTSASSCLSA